MKPFALIRSIAVHAAPIISTCGVVLSALFMSTSVQADMIMDNTRVVYPESRREVSFRTTNTNTERTALVQMWIDNGNSTESPEEVVTPFNVSPPLAKVNAGASQVVRISYLGSNLPQDRESLYWFNMLEVPPKSNADNKLTFAIRTRVKLFFGPQSLKGDPMEFMPKVKWKVVQKEGKWFIEGDNPTPFHMSFVGLNLGDASKNVGMTEGGMLPPMGQGSFPITSPDKMPKSYSVVVANFVNDFGGITPTTADLGSRK